MQKSKQPPCGVCLLCGCRIQRLGALLEKQGKIAEAIPLFTEELEWCVSHKETLDSAKHLVKLLRNADQQDEADALAARYGV